MTQTTKRDSVHERVVDQRSTSGDSDKLASHKGQDRPSSKRIESNRNNARRSTGPRSIRGKIVASRNATKHGFLSDQIACEALGETLQEFERLHEELIQDFKPLGRAEHLLVERIATCFFRLRRVSRAESSELSKNVLVIRTQPPMASEPDVGSGDLHKLVELLNEAETENGQYAVLQQVNFQLAVNGSKQTLVGIVFLKCILESYRNRIQKGEELGPTERARIIRLLNSLSPKESEYPNSDVDPRKMLLDSLEKEISNLEGLQMTELNNRAVATESSFRSCNVLPDLVIERILRYERHLERQLDKAIFQLDRLQRQRAGESVPPPLRLHID